MRFSQGRIRFGPYELDPSQGLTRLGDEVRLTPKSLQVLSVLAQQTGRIVTKEELFREVWGETNVSDSALTTCIQELRRALGDNARQPRFIETLHRRGFRFIARPAAPEVPDVLAGPGRPAPLVVGRDEVVAQLRDAYADAERGKRQLVLIRGEEGIGKTTVVQAFLGHVPRWSWGQCIEHYGAGEPYEPVLDALSRLCRQAGHDQVIAALQTYAPSWVAQLPGLAGGSQSMVTTRDRMLRELSGVMESMTAEEPLVLVIEDLHWSDTSTLDWVAAFAQRPDPARMMIICTLRSSPASDRIDALRVKKLSREIELAGLSEAAVADYTSRRYPGQTAAIAPLVHRHTDGNPLFVTNVLTDLVARGLLIESGGRWSVAASLQPEDLGVPDDLRVMIKTQFNRLTGDEKELLKAASVAGSRFATASVAAAARREPDETEAVLTALAAAQRFVRRSGIAAWPSETVGSAFEFLHALYRDVIYDELPPGRRAELHRIVGETEEAAYGDHAPEIAAELAMHFEKSPDVGRAIVYRRHAAENARRRSALSEARMHFERALALLVTQRSSADRTEQEIGVRIGLGGVIMTAAGWGAAEAADQYSKAWDLCQQASDTPRLFPALWGLWLFYWGRGPLSKAQELAGNLLTRAQRSGDRAQILQAHHACWATAFSRGELDEVIAHVGEGLRLYDRSTDAAMAAVYGNHDAGSCARAFAARAHASRGDAESARRLSVEAVATATELGHAFSLALAHVFAAAVEQSLGEARAAGAHAAAGAAIAGQQEFRLIHAWAVVYEGWARTDAEWMEQGIAEARATGSHQFMEHLLALLAEVYLKTGRPELSLRALDEADAVLRHMGGSFYEAKLRRLRDELLSKRHARPSEPPREGLP